MIERRDMAFEANGALADAERRIRNHRRISRLEEKVSLAVQDKSSVPSTEPAGLPSRRRGADADLWWQRPVRPAAAATADPVPRADAEMLPTVMVGSAIVLFKLFMLGLLIYSL